MEGVFEFPFRVRYMEVDAQGVVFNAHWLTYFDESCTRFFEWLGYEPSVAFFEEFDVMLVKAVLEWQGPAGFDELVDIRVAVDRETISLLMAIAVAVVPDDAGLQIHQYVSGRNR